MRFQVFLCYSVRCLYVLLCGFAVESYPFTPPSVVVDRDRVGRVPTIPAVLHISRGNHQTRTSLYFKGMDQEWTYYSQFRVE